MISCANATELFLAMQHDCKRYGYRRTADDPASPCKEETLEGSPGETYILCEPKFNVATCRSIDLRWAVANTLHFFAGTERADPLPCYNKHAKKYLVDTPDGLVFRGAYGSLCLGEIKGKLQYMREHLSTRRAVVHLGANGSEECVNRPACWSVLQFLNGRDGLHLLVYQRSLHVWNVMPYDCIVLCNLLLYGAYILGVKPASLRWTVGSCHTVDKELRWTGERHLGINIEPEVLDDAELCWRMLCDPSGDTLAERYLKQPTEVRT